MVPLSCPCMTTRKAIALTLWTFVGKVMSLLFNMLSKFVIAFLPRSKSLNFMAEVTVHSDFWAQENKICHRFHYFLIYLPWSSFFECWVLSQLFHSFTFTEKLFSFSSLSAIRVASSVYLRLLIFLPAILIPACSLSNLAFHMMYSEYKLNKQGDNIQPWCTLFPIWNQSAVPCLVLTVVASWPAYRFLRRQVRWSGIPISVGIFQFVVIHTVKLLLWN